MKNKIVISGLLAAALVLFSFTAEAKSKHKSKDSADTVAITAVFTASETTPFKTLAQATLDALAAGKQTEMVAKLTDLETAWDDQEKTLRPKSETVWVALDKTLDQAISALRSSHVNLDKGKAALESLLKKLDQATKP
jgi:hypothetical protein